MASINRSGLTFTDKVTIITGGANGIGAGIARVFVDAGAIVVVGDIDDALGQKSADALTQHGPGRCTFVHCDAADEASVRSLVDTTAAQFGRIDCLINNVAIFLESKPIEKYTLAELDRQWQINFVSYFVACQQALPHLRKTKGSIVNMSSLVAKVGQRRTSTYVASKGAISAFTKGLAIEVAESGVRVNAVLPGNALSDARRRGVAKHPQPDVFDKWIDTTQYVGRSAEVEEVAQVCLFLASDAASFMTGTETMVTGAAELGYGPKVGPAMM